MNKKLTLYVSADVVTFLRQVAEEAGFTTQTGRGGKRGSISHLLTQLAAAIRRGDIVDLTIFRERQEA